RAARLHHGESVRPRRVGESRVVGNHFHPRVGDRLMRVPVEAGEPFQAGQPVHLFDGVYDLRSDTSVSYQPHPDGTRLLMERAAEVVSGGSVRVMTGWRR